MEGVCRFTGWKGYVGLLDGRDMQTSLCVMCVWGGGGGLRANMVLITPGADIWETPGAW